MTDEPTAGERLESGALAQMGSATTSQAAIGIEAHQEAEKVEESLAARTLRIAGTLATKRHVAHSRFHIRRQQKTVMRLLGKVSYGNCQDSFKSSLYDGEARHG
jgi:hypothetical protein